MEVEEERGSLDPIREGKVEVELSGVRHDEVGLESHSGNDSVENDLSGTETTQISRVNGERGCLDSQLTSNEVTGHLIQHLVINPELLQVPLFEEILHQLDTLRMEILHQLDTLRMEIFTGAGKILHFGIDCRLVE